MLELFEEMNSDQLFTSCLPIYTLSVLVDVCSVILMVEEGKAVVITVTLHSCAAVLLAVPSPPWTLCPRTQSWMDVILDEQATELPGQTFSCV